MRIETTRRALELPEPTWKELADACGSNYMARNQRPLLLAAFALGARLAMEAMDNARGARREAELIETMKERKDEQ